MKLIVEEKEHGEIPSPSTISEPNRIHCSNCGKELIYIMKNIDQPLDFSVLVQAICDYCGDKSFVTEMKHMFWLSNSDDSVIGKIKQENGKTVIYTTKR